VQRAAKSDTRPRRLRFTREGRVIVVIALGVGGAAINTGHNLLFFGLGLVLSAILTSGVLSEATLRAVRVRPRRHEELRAGELSPLPVELTNPGRRLPALAVQVQLELQTPSGGRDEVNAPFVLRLGPGARETLYARWTPKARGEHRLLVATARTTYPFGFFEKRRDVVVEPPGRLLVFPARVEVREVSRALLSRLGTAPTRQAGPGDEFFSLRPYAEGDDPRRVHWRRSARVGRLVTKETEVHGSRELILELALPPAAPSEAVEHALSALGSLAEDLLERDCLVGVRTAGIALPVGAGPRQRAAILSALAACAPDDALPPPLPGRAARVGLVLPGIAAPADSEQVLELFAPHKEAA
jgi:uncharacterized protein (DUF58 family)